MSSDTDPIGLVLGRERIRAASTVVIGVAALVLLLVLVSLLSVPLSPAAATGAESTTLGLLGLLGLGLFGYVGWGVVTLVHTDSREGWPNAGETSPLIQWTAVLTVVLLVYIGLGPVVTPTLGNLGVLYDVVFLLVAVVPVMSIASCLRRFRSGKNSFADRIEAIHEDLNSGSSPESDDVDD